MSHRNRSLSPEPGMVKLIVCLDGTANSEYIRDNPTTNVSKFRRSVAPLSEDRGTRQIVHYQGGIGTGFGNPFNFWQQGLGNEIERVVIQAYTFICDNYCTTTSDEIFLVGFSRGAFAARCLGDIITLYGILTKQQLGNIHDLYQHWSNPQTHGQKPIPAHLKGPDAKITACALWDTVGAVGVPVYGATLNRKLPFITSIIPASVENVFQALALHEHRHHFFPIILQLEREKPDNPKLEQCWFAGYHADAGGGNKNDALAHFALVWIMSKLDRWIHFDLGFDMEMFKTDSVDLDREPLMPYSAWRIGGPAGAYKHKDGSYRLPVSSSMTMLFKAGRSKYRIPQTEFLRQQGFDTNETNRSLSRETMHSTARYLLQTKLVDPCHAIERLNPAQPEKTRDAWSWNLRHVSESWLWRRHSQVDRWLKLVGWQLQNVQGTNCVAEAQLDKFQWITLKYWAWRGHRQLDDGDNAAGASSPCTILVDLSAWLGNNEEDYKRAAVPVES